MLEISLGIVASCLPALRGLIQIRIADSMMHSMKLKFSKPPRRSNRSGNSVHLRSPIHVGSKRDTDSFTLSGDENQNRKEWWCLPSKRSMRMGIDSCAKIFSKQMTDKLHIGTEKIFQSLKKIPCSSPTFRPLSASRKPIWGYCRRAARRNVQPWTSKV